MASWQKVLTLKTGGALQVATVIRDLLAASTAAAARVSAANTLALTFGNFTAGALAPPAGVFRVIAWRS